MIRRIVGASLLAALVLMSHTGTASAQLQDNLGALSGENAKGYLGPLTDAFSGTMNAAVFHTGHIPKQGFYIKVGARLMGVTLDDDQRTYRPTDPPGFQSTGPVDAPTVTGDTKSVSQPGQGGTTLYHPGGFDIGEFAFGSPQITVGAVAGTQVTIRFISLEIGDSDLGKFDLFGIGAQHSLSQYMENLPVDLAFGAFYQQFKIDDKLVDTNAWHFNVTGSKDLGILQPYVGLGLDTFKMDAEYSESQSGTTIAVDFDSQTDFHLTLGAEASLALVKLYGEVNVAAATGVALGLSFGN